MSVILYKPGNSTKVRGIPCDIMICNEYSYLHNLEQGYFYSPEECYPEVEEAEVEEAEVEVVEVEEPEKEEEAEPVLTFDQVADVALPDDEVRLMAKEAGIGNWHTKKTENLLKELEDMTDG